MSLDHIFGVASTALNAQTVRMNTTASNMANAASISSTEEGAFRAKRAVFKALVNESMTNQGAPYVGGVKVAQIADDPTPVRKVFQPGNPMADKDGFIYQSNVSEVGEMVDMMAAARSYQNNVEVINTARQLLLRTLEITKA
jgi:flagellar basal-body rod protein FlgC